MKLQTALLLGFTVPDELAQQLYVLDPAPPAQTHYFAWSLTRALSHVYESVYLLSAAPVQNYPITRRGWFWGGNFQSGGVKGRMIGFVNLIVLKHLTRLIGCLLALPQVLGQWRVRDVFIHGVHSPFLLFGVLLRLFGCRVVPVLTDPPGVIRTTDGLLARMLKHLDVLIVRALVSRCSAVIALAPELVRPYENKMPVLVLPGILNRSWVKKFEQARIDAMVWPAAEKRHRPLVIYAGGMFAAYGVDRLIAAAAELPEVDFLLCGKGDQTEILQQLSLPNIDYPGFVQSDRLAQAMQDAAILINPRPSQLEFAVQSFPSKLIEYLYTDRPVLTTRIQSIPSQLADSFFYIEDESPSGIAAAIREVLAQRAASARPARSTSSVVTNLYGEEAVGHRFLELLQRIGTDTACEREQTSVPGRLNG